jgi:LmbE family N-acetylglucosaminyl deacetylase
MGGTLAKYSREGVETSLITATRGERGRFGSYGQVPSLEAVGRIRETELREAAEILGIGELSFLDYVDGDLDRAEPSQIIARIVYHLRRIRPHVVVTFGPDGAYGHPDHIAISQFATAATVCAADPNHLLPGMIESDYPAHAVSKLYYMAWSDKKWAAYQAALRTLTSRVDGIERQATPWPEWAITTVVDTGSYWPIVWKAVSCHRSQMAIYEKLQDLPGEHHQALWGSQEYYRAYSLANGGRDRETDLFEGLRH